MKRFVPHSKYEVINNSSHFVSLPTNVCLGYFEEHTWGIGMDFFTKMGYNGGGLGTASQGNVQPVEVEEHPWYQGLGYHETTYGECSWENCSYFPKWGHAMDYC